MAKYPVTNSRFAEFIADGGYKREELWEKGWNWLIGQDVKSPAYWQDKKFNQADQPVVGVSWFEAQAFAKWKTKTSNDNFIYKLPMERQWEAAARGREGRIYPWGNDGPDEKLCNYYNVGETPFTLMTVEHSLFRIGLIRGKAECAKTAKLVLDHDREAGIQDNETCHSRGSGNPGYDGLLFSRKH